MRLLSDKTCSIAGSALPKTCLVYTGILGSKTILLQ